MLSKYRLSCSGMPDHSAATMPPVFSINSRYIWGLPTLQFHYSFCNFLSTDALQFMCWARSCIFLCTLLCQYTDLPVVTLENTPSITPLPLFIIDHLPINVANLFHLLTASLMCLHSTPKPAQVFWKSLILQRPAQLQAFFILRHYFLVTLLASFLALWYSSLASDVFHFSAPCHLTPHTSTAVINIPSLSPPHTSSLLYSQWLTTLSPVLPSVLWCHGRPEAALYHSQKCTKLQQLRHYMFAGIYFEAL